MKLAVAIGASLVAFSAAASARADDDDAPRTPPPATGVYPAPMSQTTQSTYVPQSVAMSGPREIDAVDEDAPPAGYRAETRARKGLIIGGAVTFGSLYMISALAAAAGADANRGETNPLAAMWVPGVGPFIQLASTTSSTAKVFLTIDGLAQTSGLVMLVYGLASPKSVFVRNDLAQSKPKIMPVPIVTASGGGAGVVGTF